MRTFIYTDIQTHILSNGLNLIHCHTVQIFLLTVVYIGSYRQTYRNSYTRTHGRRQSYTRTYSVYWHWIGHTENLTRGLLYLQTTTLTVTNFLTDTFTHVRAYKSHHDKLTLIKRPMTTLIIN